MRHVVAKLGYELDSTADATVSYPAVPSYFLKSEDVSQMLAKRSQTVYWISFVLAAL